MMDFIVLQPMSQLRLDSATGSAIPVHDMLIASPVMAEAGPDLWKRHTSPRLQAYAAEEPASKVIASE
jgi:hypothetical protein